MQKISCSWKDNMAFQAKDEFGHTVVMDLAEDAGGNNEGFRPMPMLLVGLGGCLGVDVKIILDKMKVEIDSLDLDIEGIMDVTKTPKTYEEIVVTFKFKGRDLDLEKLERAINLAEEKYCNVSAILSQTCKISHRTII
ncbi:MAG: OsmC family protein [Gudongella sp.]|nr:OsmC family protein [Gudongella sp.]